jgi:YD repeat-containing protein
VTKPVVLIVVTVAILQGLLVPIAEAQAEACQTQVVCSIYSLYYGACISLLPLGAHNCTWNGPWSAICDLPTYLCIPTPCPTCAAGAASKPIDLATGNTYIEESDLRIPGFGGGLALSRTWNSQTPGYGMFGLGWSSNVEDRIYMGRDYLVKQLRGDGSIWSYGFSSYSPDGTAAGYLTAGPRNGGASAQLNSTSFTITLKSGEQKTFDPTSGDLLWAADRNGNKTVFSYDSSNRLVTITDPASRHLYFTYTQISVGAMTVNVVTSITSDSGVSVSYQYDTAARLVKVTAPDNTFLTFAYSPSSLITTVLDTSGKILESHTYDALGRGLTASRAGGVDAVTVSYSY